MINFFRASLLILVLTITACSGTKELSQPSTSSDTETRVAETPAKITEPTEDWHLSPSGSGPFIGTGVDKAYDEIISKNGRNIRVIVAIIDSGTDVDHEDLKANIWVNKDEIPGNGIDDDDNGYVDDIHGWNFIGGPDSTHVSKDTYEMTRIYASLNKIYEGLTKEDLNESEYEEFEYYQEVKKAFESRKSQNDQELTQLTQIMTAITESKRILQVENIDSLSTSDLLPKAGDSMYKQQAKQIMSQIIQNGATEADINDTQEYLDYLQGLQDYGLNPDFDPRGIVGDDYDDLSNRFYGNNDVEGPDHSHGTHVAGIVGAVRTNNIGIKGIADIELMIIRAVPDGDERDKDVANAIRYAADNGARVVNMSFGKGYSPQKWYVDEAVRYADSLGVLMITGAGNDGNNIDDSDSFPSKYYENGGIASNFINVGASSWERDSTLAASFSNYGKEKVDIFAPGVRIYSTYPDNEYKKEDGTSMAAPVVSGIAALIMSQYPDLSTEQVKEIILSTVTLPETVSYTPGSDQKAPFNTLSSTGGIINAYNALLKAQEMSSKVEQ
ncbi:S8 family peptidase [Balneola sp. MJW-20]|uniref:S8 family peptidase n=1 Tax=Gracilimonas aurantiaca TaxID=3234185 RepID=UPI0034653BD0